MRTIHVLAFVGFSFAAVGCGGLGAGTSAAAANSSAVSDSANESADIVSSFAQESSGVTAYALPYKGGKISPNVTGAERAELVVALEAIAADPNACTTGSASITPTGDKTADCTNIGTNGSYPGGATLQFNSCALANGGKLNGTITVAVTRSLSAGAVCGPSASEDVTHEVTFTNLSYTSPSLYVLSYPTFDAVVDSTHNIDASPTLLTLTSVTGERTIKGPAGALLLDHMLSGSGSVALASGSRTVNGTFTVIHELLHFTATAVLTNVERVETCCKPISGTIAVTLTSNITDLAISGTFSYGPSCGDINLDGNLVAVAECL